GKKKLCLSGTPIQNLYLIGQPYPCHTQPGRNGHFKRIAFALMRDGTKNSQPHSAIVCRRGEDYRWPPPPCSCPVCGCRLIQTASPRAGTYPPGGSTMLHSPPQVLYRLRDAGSAV